jgi:hypothetical protein
MRWSAPADRRVVDAVVATFCDSPERSRERLAALEYRDWARTYHWLDASGMALYFLDELQTLGIEDALPTAVIERFSQNLADNRRRSAALFEEFTEINRAFQQAGVLYSNLKGFTLSPESCPNPALRCQLDLDFLVDARHLEMCSEILARTGYRLTAATGTTWEFKAGSHELARMEDHYKPKPQRSVELHFAVPAQDGCSLRDERLDRLRLHSWGGIAFPALSVGDLFVGQALHLFGHMRSACTRLAWLLEYKRHISAHYDDREFWGEVEECSQAQPQAAIAIGLVTFLSAQIFMGNAPELLETWTVDRLPAGVRMWANHYGRRALLADFPGTKLYLLLEDELARGNSSWQKKKRGSLLPLHRVPTIVYEGPEDNLFKSVRRNIYQARFVLFRLRFHVVEGLRYMIEAARWKRRTVALQACLSYETSKSPSPGKRSRS